MTEKTITAPRILIAATQSGSGKTTITCGILELLRRRGIKPQAYKVGPDYIDPTYLSIASGAPAHNLDTWLLDEDKMTDIFAKSTDAAGVSVVEGVMGLYDGGHGGISSTAAIAKKLSLPVILVIDVKSMGESAAAIAMGFHDYDKNVLLKGVIINRVGSENHRQMVCEAMEKIGVPVLGVIHRDSAISIKERHLGLLPAQENENRDHIKTIADTIENDINLEAIIALAQSASPMTIKEKNSPSTQRQVKIAVAKDEAFSFYYPESLSELERAGAELTFFSPLKDSSLPTADGLIFGGGFPEIFAKQLAENIAMKESIKKAACANIPIYAECGGFMYLTESITDFEGKTHEMAGVIPARCSMNDRLRTVGYVEAEALCDTVICPAGTVIKGHEFHFSSSEANSQETWPCAFTFCKKRTGEKYLAGYAKDSVLASYLHLHFAGDSTLAENFIKSCAEQAKKTH